ncbi:MAG TPA: DUF4097 family beta strand repeat-containing protein [Gemmatimonadales bacterium]|nr:DUF4097 family beta strand repeat-containing protein [Gemmatimonadales bacterium]
MLTTIATLALLLQATPAPPAPPSPAPRPRVKVHAPEAPRWNSRRDRDDDSELTRDTSFAVRQGQRLEVDNFGGSITVTAGSDDRIRITAASSGDAFQVDGGSITINVSTSAGRYGGPGDAELTIQVPAWMELELSGNEVDISTRGMRNSVKANTVDGTIVIDGAEGSVDASSVEGDVTISNVKGRVQLNTVEGAVTLTNISGTAVEAETVDGDIEMTGVTTPNISANTVDGDISWSGSLAPTGSYRFATHDGDLMLRISGEPDATVSVDTFDGSLDSDWPVTLTGSQRRRMTFTLGAGRARLELSSFDGRISLKRGSGR